MIWSKQKGEKVLEKKLRWQDLNPDFLIQSPLSIPLRYRALVKILKKFLDLIHKEVLEILNLISRPSRGVQRCPEVQINKIQQRTA